MLTPQVAIKTMKKTFESLAPCLELREVVFLRSLPPHPHLVPALDIFLDPASKKLHIAMEYMDANLYQLIKARDHKCLPVASVKSILVQIMAGLEHIHAHHFFHRDIKPENILVSTAPQNDSPAAFRRSATLVAPPPAAAAAKPAYTVKIADFGLARETHSRLPYTTYVSTRWYRAPEVLLRAGEYSAPVDIWAMGAMAVEIATLKPLFPGGNEVDQVWRVCEIMGSPGLWHDRHARPVGGGDWKDGTRLASKLGFSFPKMAPHAMDTILLPHQWPASLGSFVTWCLLWDPAARPTSTQALAHEFLADAVDPLRPTSAASRILARKPSDLSHRHSVERSELRASQPPAAKPSWFRKSLIARGDAPALAPLAAPAPGKENVAPRPAPIHAATGTDLPRVKSRPQLGKRSTWASAPSTMAPMPILPSIKPVSPLSHAVTAQARNTYGDPSPAASTTMGRQLSVASHGNPDADLHRQQAEAALNGHTGLASPLSGARESFFSHLRKRARRLSGRRSQTPRSPSLMDLEAQAGCGPWSSNRSSLVVDPAHAPSPVPRSDSYDALDQALRTVQQNLDSPPAYGRPVAVPGSEAGGDLKRHHSLPKQHARSADNLRTGAPISTRTRRGQPPPHGAARYETPDEEEELLDEVLTSTHKVLKRMYRDPPPLDTRPVLRASASSNLGMANPYPTPSPSASGSRMPFATGNTTPTPAPAPAPMHKYASKASTTPPYEHGGNEWATSAAASILAVQNRI